MIARLALALIFALANSSGEVQPTAEITDYGTYSAIVVVKGNWKLGLPVSIDSVDELKQIRATTRIPAQDGVYWGLHAAIKNTTAQAVAVVCIITHPPIHSPDGKTSSEDDSGTFTIAAGQTGTAESMWFFIKECPFEFVPGKWTIRVTINGKTAATKEFVVYKPDADGAK